MNLEVKNVDWKARVKEGREQNGGGRVDVIPREGRGRCKTMRGEREIKWTRDQRLWEVNIFQLFDFLEGY